MGTVFKKTDEATAPGRGGNHHPQGRAVRPLEGPQGQDPDGPADDGQGRGGPHRDRIAVLRRQVPRRLRRGAGRVDRLPRRNRRPASAGRPRTPGRAGALRTSSPRPKPPSATTRPRRLGEHLDAYDEHHQAKGVTKIHREDTGRYLRRLAADCAFGTLADLRREALERWLAAADRRRACRPGRGTPTATPWCRSATGASRRAGSPATLRCRAEGKREGRPAPATPGDDGGRTGQAARRRTGTAAARSADRPQGAAEGRALRRRAPRSPRTARTARAGTGADLQDAGPDRAAQGRIGFPDRGPAAPRRRRARSPPSTPRTKRTAKATTSPCGTTSPPTCATGSPTSCARLQAEALAAAAPIPARLPPDTPLFDVPAQLVKILDRDLVAAGIARRVKVDGNGPSTSATTGAGASTFTPCGRRSGR